MLRGVNKLLSRPSVVAVHLFHCILLLHYYCHLIHALNFNMNLPSLSERKAISQSFPAKAFTTPWYIQSGHYQTIVGSGALKSKFFGQPPRPFQITSEEIETPDNDSFLVEYTSNIYDENVRGIVIIMHGLESSSRSGLCTNLAIASMEKGFACCLFNFRGCHGVENKTPGGYHVGFTDDLNILIHRLNEQHPTKKLFLTGFSLGGNVILKYLGEQEHQAYEKHHIRGAAVTCVPFDPTGCQRKLDVGISRVLYSKNFLNTLKKKAERQNERFPGTFDIEAIRQATTIGEFDEAYIAKIYNFADKFDYYTKCGSKQFLKRIHVPTVAINAIDDPFIESTSLPTDDDVLDAPVRLIYHENGGHCGFETTSAPKHGWIAEELISALKHFSEELHKLEETINVVI